MKRILFVDDEPLILDALQRLLYDMRREWEISFASDGAQALKIMAETPADIVISDMRMPHMNGAQLLNEIMWRHPKTVRFILSGFADMEMIMQCVGGTHQFLSKPCDCATLKNVIRRALETDAWLNSDKIKAVVASMRTLPSVPTLYFEILRELGSPGTTLDKVGATIAQDPAMTTKILQLVNSAYFGLSRRFSSPTEAVTQLGLETIKSLVLGIHIFSEFEGLEAGGLSIKQLWRHSLATATTAKHIAELEQQDERIVEESFTAGLLHDIGRLVLLANLPALYTDALSHSQNAGIPLIQAETEIFGANHADIGGYLLGLWGLPISLVETAVFHHYPARGGIKEFSPLAIVHVANVLEQSPIPGQDRALPPQLDQDYLTAIGKWDRVQSWSMELEKCPATGTPS